MKACLLEVPSALGTWDVSLLQSASAFLQLIFNIRLLPLLSNVQCPGTSGGFASINALVLTGNHRTVETEMNHSVLGFCLFVCLSTLLFGILCTC